jgi:HAMP domain-containing protein/CheY-like chemotaxis protein/signal transduction histidine kinase
MVSLIALHSRLDKRQLANALSSLRKGDFSVRMPTGLAGVDGQIADEFNELVEINQRLVEELERISQGVGKQGQISQRASIGKVSGAWQEAISSVNSLVDDLVHPTAEMARVIGAVAKGDLSQSVALEIQKRPLEGEFLRIARTVNTMVDQLSSFASEVTRVAREVGTEGKLGGQAQVPGVAGTWKDLTDSVNSMAGNLTAQVRNIAAVTTAVANGDLTKKITVEVRGEILELKNTINTMVDQLNSFASEVTRVAREVGTEGKLGGQADVRGVAGTWKDLTDNVNFMAGNLTGQVRNIAAVTTAVANGDLTKKITVEVRGEILELKNTINIMVDQLNSFASEVTRVAREVGTEGKLGGQADVRGVSGVWKDLTDNVNFMAANLTNQVRNIADVTKAVAAGDLSKKITVDVKGEILELKNTVNTMVDQLSSFASEVTRVAREVGTEGKLGGQADVRGVSGTWKDLTDSVNSMAGNLTGQVRNIAAVTTAVANGDLSKKITVDVRGEILELKNTINTMVDQLNSFASEVTRVAREVGTEGKLGGQADVRGVSGTWKDLTDNVNSMASNLTSQVRGIAKVVTAVANGDLKRKLTVEAKGEIAELADTINNMIDTLATFAEQVTTVAREVGVDGKLGGQAKVPGAAGTWKDLTDNVNQLAANLTTQVRAIAEVATAVTKGDLTRSIKVEASGEVAALKDNINEMIRNLKDTTIKNNEQDWLKTNLAKFSRMLQGQKDLLTVGKLILSELAPVVGAQHGVFYTMISSGEEPRLHLLASYAFRARKHTSFDLKLGETLVGQAALEKERILLTKVPPDYVQISSGLGAATPLNLIVLPVLFEGQVKAVIELASFEQFSPTHLIFLDQLTESIGIVLNTIEANMRTEDLLKQSQSLARELQSQQEELQKTNLELEDKARLLAEQNVEVEKKNMEVEQARQALEEKAAQLALTSKYKSEFLANMSHELRTPLNSLLILSDQLCLNKDGNLTGKQIEFAKTIHSSGHDLLRLINDILDLAKIESGTVSVEVSDLRLNDLKDYVERTFLPIAEHKKLDYSVMLDPALPRAVRTDAKRLQQILKNLLSNAFKFTERGRVSLDIALAADGWSADHTTLNNAPQVVSFRVSDSGIGIPPEKQQIIFEAFQQADSGTNRKYGGTGLGLSISREIARLLGGEIHLVSTVGEGSAFTLYLPSVIGPADRTEMTSFVIPNPAGLIQRVTREITAAPAAAVEVRDDRESIAAEDRAVLIVEDDPVFATQLLDLTRAHGFKGVVAMRGSDALQLARRIAFSAITLDLMLPDIDGRRVLYRLKDDPATRHIPVVIISAVDADDSGLKFGALSHIPKPVATDRLAEVLISLKSFIDRPVKSLLLVEDNDVQRQSTIELIGNADVETCAVATGQEGLSLLKQKTFDCVVLDLGLPDMSGAEFIEEVKAAGLGTLPIVVHTGRELPKDQVDQMKRLARTVILKDVQSPERLFDETALFLHRNVLKLPDDKRRLVENLHKDGEILARKRALIVDDDMRNIFAMTSFLERYDMQVQAAETGLEALATLETSDGFDVILMDIMMPDMDGYETMRRIRQMETYRDLPILALTAKAMKGDREKCIEAGASDYIAKPVDTEHLLSLLRIWLHR